MIGCSPLRLVLSASSDEERQRWIDNLQLRVELWKSKALAEGPKVAQVLDFDIMTNDSSFSDESRMADLEMSSDDGTVTGGARR